jgi:hypothetical protein
MISKCKSLNKTENAPFGAFSLIKQYIKNLLKPKPNLEPTWHRQLLRNRQYLHL